MSPAADRSITDYERAYAQSGFESVQAAYRKRMLLALLAQVSPRRVLEVGCGLDTLANHWTAPDGFVVVEPGAAFAAEARRATAGAASVTVLEAPFEIAAAGLNADFDLILLSGLLHEVIDCGGLLDAARSLCGPTTLVHVNVPNARSFHRLLALEMGLIAAVTDISPLQSRLQQQRTFTLEGLEDLSRSHGFRVVQGGSYFVKPFTHAQMQALQDGGLMTAQMLDGLWGMSKYMPDLGSEIYLNLRLA